jgi:hypothetical protein
MALSNGSPAERISTLLPRPDAEDELDFFERDLQRLRLLRRVPREYESVKQAPEWDVNLKWTAA